MAQAPKGAFVGYVCGNDDVTPKPDPAPYWRAASMVGLPADASGAGQCLVFEDSKPGLTAARASGATVVAVTGHARVDMSDSGLCDEAIVDYRGLTIADLAAGCDVPARLSWRCNGFMGCSLIFARVWASRDSVG